MIKEYRCECGKEFEKPNSFNGHKSNCRIHFEAVGKDFDRHKQLRDKGNKSAIKKRVELFKIKKFQEFKEMQLRCEKCNKIMIQKFGSGRFCSRKCANSRQVSEEHKNKTSNSMKNEKVKAAALRNHYRALEKYNLNPNKCKNCSNVLSYEKKK